MGVASAYTTWDTPAARHTATVAAVIVGSICAWMLGWLARNNRK